MRVKLLRLIVAKSDFLKSLDFELLYLENFKEDVVEVRRYVY